MGKPVPFKGFDHTPAGRLLKNYWAAPSDCRQCPSKSSCAPRTRCRKITRTAYDEQYQRAYARQHSKRGKQMKQLRQSTVEPVFGSLVQHYGLHKINVLGKAAAHKVMLLAAVAFNLKKYMKFKPTRVVNMAIAMERERIQASFTIFLDSLPTQSNNARAEISFQVQRIEKAIEEGVVQQPPSFIETINQWKALLQTRKQDSELFPACDKTERESACLLHQKSL